MIFAEDNSSISLSQTTLDLNGTKITKISQNQKFIYHFEVKNSSKYRVKNIKITDSLPQDLTIVKFIDSQNRWICKNSQENSIDCSLKGDLISKKVEVLEVVVRLNPTDEDEIINSAFVNDYDNDVSSLKIYKKDSIKVSKKSFKCSVDNDKPKVDDIVNFLISSDEDEKVIVNLDENLKYIENDRCRYEKLDLICEAKKESDLNISAKVLDYGFAISDFTLLNDKNITRSIPIQVDRDFIPNLHLSVNSNKERVVAGDRYRYKIDINASSLKEDLDDVRVVLTTLSEQNFKYIKTSLDNSLCEQNGLQLNCLIDKLDKNSTISFFLEVEAPTSGSNIAISTKITPNSSDIEPTIYEQEIVEFDYSKDRKKDFLKTYDLSTSGRLINIGDTIFKQDSLDILANSKIFRSFKSTSFAKLDINDDEEIIFAKLYWMGKIDKNVDFKKIKDAKNISFKNQNDKEFKTLESDLDEFSWINDGDYFLYRGVVDVSEYLKKRSSGIYEVTDLEASEGFGADSNWNLVVVTKKKEVKDSSKKITIFDGFLVIWSSKSFKRSKEFQDSLNLKFEDFKTSSTKKPDAKIFLSYIGGDSGYMDKLSISDKDGVTHTYMDVLENFKNVDMDISYALMKEQRSTDISISSLGDKVYMGVVGLEVAIEK
jgi:uncharacterized repeat protein (TIGR01451 family)